MKFCLIGEKLGHSFSVPIHRFYGAEYELREIARDSLGDFVKNCPFDGFNVTIPYKTEIMRYLDEVEPRAAKIGSVNTVVYRGGKSVGYNTDIDGIAEMLAFQGIPLGNKHVMILGSGGTGRTAAALASEAGAKSVTVVSRQGKVNYANYAEKKETQIVINTAPVGMYPDNGGKLISLDFPALEGVADVIYNPLKTRLILEAEARGVPAAGGLRMLVAQAFFSEALWRGVSLDRALLDGAYRALRREMTNVVLIGMPGAGKSAIARRLSACLVETDALVEARAGKTIPALFEEAGERAFRDLESAAVREAAALHGRVISTGGGAVLRQQNVEALRQNGVLIWVKRPLCMLAVKNRPLSGKQGVENLYRTRRKKYAAAADFAVNNGGTFARTLRKIEEKLNEYFGN